MTTSKNDTLTVLNSNDHYYPVPKKNVPRLQHEKSTYSVKFTQAGLENLREKHKEVYDQHKFLGRILSNNPREDHVQEMICTPQYYPYFAEEGFLVIPNRAYDLLLGYKSKPRSMKLTEAGITLCAWYLHPKLIKESFLLNSDANSSDQESFYKLVKECAKKNDICASNEGDDSMYSVGELSGYLASILDLNKAHLPMLKSLSKKVRSHLKKEYGICKHDSLQLYFHFPYVERAVTLHLHVRANHGEHGLETESAFSIDEIINGFEEGKEIDTIVLEKQEKYGKFYVSHPVEHAGYFNIPGVDVIIGDKNPFIYTKKISGKSREDTESYISNKGQRSFATDIKAKRSRRSRSLPPL